LGYISYTQNQFVCSGYGLVPATLGLTRAQF
jgi:hypothetical protein